MVVALEINEQAGNTWLTSEDMAQVLGVTVRTVRNMVSRGELERKRMQGRVYVRHVESFSPVQSVAPVAEHRGDVLAHPAVVEMVTTLQQQLLSASQDFANRLQALNDNLLDERVEKERSNAEVARLSAANQTILRDLDSERAKYRTELSSQVRRHNTELTRAVANAATEKSDAKRRFRSSLMTVIFFALALSGISFALGAGLETEFIIDVQRLQIWKSGSAVDPAGWTFWISTGLLTVGGLFSLGRLMKSR